MRLSPLQNGLALALTVGLLYVACAVLVIIAPEATPTVVRLVVHGLDTGAVAISSSPPALPSVAVGLVLISAYSFVAGALYGWIGNRLARA